jgi:hypothetical protein
MIEVDDELHLHMVYSDGAIVILEPEKVATESNMKNMWNFVECYSPGVTPTLFLVCRVNNEAYLASFTDSHMINDDPSNRHLIGAEVITDAPGSSQLTNFYNGYIWEFKIYDEGNTTVENLNSCLNCSVCPEDICLSNCEVNQYPILETMTCGECRSDCLEGCTRAENCNLCADDECNICSNFNESYIHELTLADASWCKTCIENAQKPSDVDPESIDDDCKCITDWYYDAPLHQCLQCNDLCQVCLDTTNYTCDECT